MRNGSDKSARYRYVLQAGILEPNGMLLPFMHESMDIHNPVTDKEDCEFEAFIRLAARIKEAFPRMSFCLVGTSYQWPILAKWWGAVTAPRRLFRE